MRLQIFDIMRFILILMLVSFPHLVFSQRDTTIASKTVNESTFYLDDTGKINQKHLKNIGNEIPHLVIFNLTNNNISIKLSANGLKWNEFLLNPVTKNIYRCDNIQKLYVIINQKASILIKAKIYTGKKYKIFYDNQLNIFDINEI